MSDHDGQTTVGATDDLLAEVQAWVAQEKAPPERPPPSAEDLWRASGDAHWRPPGRLEGAAPAPVPTPLDNPRSAVGLMAAIGLVGALIGGSLVWLVAGRDPGPPAVDEPGTEIHQADDDSQLGG